MIENLSATLGRTKLGDWRGISFLVILGCESPNFSVFPASRNPDKLIGSKNPGHGGGLVGRHDPADSGKEGEDV